MRAPTDMPGKIPRGGLQDSRWNQELARETSQERSERLTSQALMADLGNQRAFHIRNADTGRPAPPIDAASLSAMRASLQVQDGWVNPEKDAALAAWGNMKEEEVSDDDGTAGQSHRAGLNQRIHGVNSDNFTEREAARRDSQAVRGGRAGGGGRGGGAVGRKRASRARLEIDDRGRLEMPRRMRGLTGAAPPHEPVSRKVDPAPPARAPVRNPTAKKNAGKPPPNESTSRAEGQRHAHDVKGRTVSAQPWGPVSSAGSLLSADAFMAMVNPKTTQQKTEAAYVKKEHVQGSMNEETEITGERGTVEATEFVPMVKNEVSGKGPDVSVSGEGTVATLSAAAVPEIVQGAESIMNDNIRETMMSIEAEASLLDSRSSVATRRPTLIEEDIAHEEYFLSLLANNTPGPATQSHQRHAYSKLRELKRELAAALGTTPRLGLRDISNAQHEAASNVPNQYTLWTPQQSLCRAIDNVSLDRKAETMAQEQPDLLEWSPLQSNAGAQAALAEDRLEKPGAQFGSLLRRAEMEPKNPSTTNASSRLYVSGLHPELTEFGVARLFSQFGGVEHCELEKTRDTLESRGSAYVTMRTAGQAKAAKKGLHAQDVGGRILYVKKAKSINDDTGTASSASTEPETAQFTVKPPQPKRYGPKELVSLNYKLDSFSSSFKSNSRTVSIHPNDLPGEPCTVANIIKAVRAKYESEKRKDSEEGSLKDRAESSPFINPFAKPRGVEGTAKQSKIASPAMSPKSPFKVQNKPIDAKDRIPPHLVGLPVNDLPPHLRHLAPDEKEETMRVKEPEKPAVGQRKKSEPEFQLMASQRVQADIPQEKRDSQILLEEMGEPSSVVGIPNPSTTNTEPNKPSIADEGAGKEQVEIQSETNPPAEETKPRTHAVPICAPPPGFKEKPIKPAGLQASKWSPKDEEELRRNHEMDAPVNHLFQNYNRKKQTHQIPNWLTAEMYGRLQANSNASTAREGETPVTSEQAQEVSRGRKRFKDSS